MSSSSSVSMIEVDKEFPILNTRQPTICQLLHSLNVGGAEILAERLGRQLKDKYRFVFACLDELGPLGKQLQDSGYAVHVLNRKPGWDLACARELRNWLRSEQVDLIHAHQYTPFSYALLSGLVSQRPPVLFTEHGRWFPDFRRFKRVLFNRSFLRKKDRVVAVGEYVRQALINNEGLPGERVRVIHNGVDVEQYQPAHDDSERNEIRLKLGVPQDAFLIVQVARLDALKDHLTAIWTLEQVQLQQPNAQLLLVGDGPERNSIESEAASRGLSRHVHFLGTRNDVAALLKAADVFLLSSISEGVPLTIIEAMLTHVPVVSTDVGGISEIIVHNETGLLVPAKDHVALSAAVLRFSEPSDWQSKLVECAADRAEQYFSESANHIAYERLYSEMLGNRN